MIWLTFEKYVGSVVLATMKTARCLCAHDTQSTAEDMPQALNVKRQRDTNNSVVVSLVKDTSYIPLQFVKLAKYTKQSVRLLCIS